MNDEGDVVCIHQLSHTNWSFKWKLSSRLGQQQKHNNKQKAMEKTSFNALFASGRQVRKAASFSLFPLNIDDSSAEPILCHYNNDCVSLFFCFVMILRSKFQLPASFSLLTQSFSTFSTFHFSLDQIMCVFSSSGRAVHKIKALSVPRHSSFCSNRRSSQSRQRKSGPNLLRTMIAAATFVEQTLENFCFSWHSLSFSFTHVHTNLSFLA